MPSGLFFEVKELKPYHLENKICECVAQYPRTHYIERLRLFICLACGHHSRKAYKLAFENNI